MSRIFEIVQAMSGQKNCIVIPRPYIDFFSEDQQAFALAAVLNQLVFWSGKSSRDDGWFYKGHQELAGEIGLSEDQVQRVVKKLRQKYLPNAIEVANRKVNGTPVNHYRIIGDALIAEIFPSHMDSAESRNGKREDAESTTQNCGKETAESRNGNREDAESYLYPDQYKQITKTPSCQVAPQPDESGDEKFLSRHPEAAVFSAKKKIWGSAEDLKCAEWIRSRIVKLYEQAAESDGEVARPKEPNWADWANEIRLMCSQDGRTHKQICELFAKANRDPFWCKNILSPSKLREKWDDLTLKLSVNPVSPAGGHWNTAEAWENTL